MSVDDADIPANYTMNNISVLAGHFSWGVWRQLPQFKRNLMATAVDGLRRGHDTPSCFIMGRHPVDRAISYYYQRCYQIEDCAGYQTRLNLLTTDQLRHFIISDRQGERRNKGNLSSPIFVLDEGMSDAGCRAVGNFKKTTGLILGVDALRIPQALTGAETQAALDNAAQCVIGLQERWSDSKRVMKHWFPWINLDIGDSERRRMHLFSDKETKETIREDLRRVIEEENTCDMLLHLQMITTFEKQMSLTSLKESAY
jgi:hypothetical protein